MSYQRKIRRTFRSETKGVSLKATFHQALIYANGMPNIEGCPKSVRYIADVEHALNVLTDYGDVSWYHGGNGALGVGDVLLPGTITGQAPLRSTGKPRTFLHPKVSITWNEAVAKSFAQNVSGRVFRVIPDSRVEVGRQEVRALSLLVASDAFRGLEGRLDRCEVVKKIALICDGFICDSARIVEVRPEPVD